MKGEKREKRQDKTRQDKTRQDKTKQKKGEDQAREEERRARREGWGGRNRKYDREEKRR